ncbi:hypothetical protein GCM10022212_36750 [Actimicrobium antarcticum]|uniref:Diguanylate cyclase n=2 Tax=Actimicrobium antarcticum TaxID=1051899 RepID=A0ABP7U0H7_9BURK
MLVSILMLVNGPVGAVIASSETDYRSDSRVTLVVGSEQQYPPFSTGMTDNSAGGFTVDLWKAVAKEAGLDYAIHVRPFHQLLQEFKDGKADVLINLAISDERRKFADFTVPHVIVTGAVFVRKDNATILTEDDLAGKSVIVVNADMAFDYATSRGWTKQLVLVDTAAEGLQLLASGKHDAMLLSKLTGMQTLQAEHLSNLKALELKAGFAQRFAFAVNKGQSELLSRLNEALALTKSNGTYEALYLKWFGVYEVREARLGDFSGYLLAALTILLATAGYFFHRRQLDRAKADNKYRDLYDQSPDMFLSVDLESRNIIGCNQTLLTITGYSRQQIIGSKALSLCCPGSAALAQSTFRQFLSTHEMPNVELQLQCSDGRIVDVSVWASAAFDAPATDADDYRILHLALRDITLRKAAEEEISQLAFFDSLTALPNRRMLLDRLGRALASSLRTGRDGALMFIDLDNFKALNDTLGHDKGDLLLQQVAKRLAASVREVDTVARLGGDEFVVMLEDLSEHSGSAAIQAEAIGEKILTALNVPYDLAGHAHHSTPSIGITLFAQNKTNDAELLKRADLAMYQAKAAGRNTLRFFDPKIQDAVDAHAALEVELRNAVEQEDFVLYYQAQVDGNSTITGVEVLVRWKHAQRGIVAPYEFIALAEETGLILPLGNWVLDNACRQLTSWAVQPGLAALTISVNVSAFQFQRPDFVDQVLAILASTGANPALLKLEITESLLLKDVEDIILKMTVLQAQGVRFSLDDFGTGYSSLSYLKRLPLDQLKIDRSFVRDVLTDPNDASIVRTILALGYSLGLTVIAEGVETQAQRDFLAVLDCHDYQGYLFSKPVRLAEFEYLVSGLREAA